MTARTRTRRLLIVGTVTTLLATGAACSGEQAVSVPGVERVPASVDSATPARPEVFSRVAVDGPPPRAPSAATPATPVAPVEADIEPAATSTTNTADPPTTDFAAPATTMPPPAVEAEPSRPTPAPVIGQVTGWPAFDLHLQTIVDAGSPAVSATVLRNGEIVHEVALGLRTPDGDPVQIGDRFRVASISKVITAITVLRLVQSGQLELDAPVGARLAARVGAAPSAGVDSITVRHLLTHRSGIAQYENLMFARQVESCEQAAATGLSRALERSPGTTLRYSNLNFCLLGLLIEDVTGRPYDDVVRTELLEPLQLDGMRLAGTFDIRDGEVDHRSDAGRNYMEVLGASGSWIASPTDVATIIDSLDLTTTGWKPLSADLVATMTTITVDPTPAEPEVTSTEPAGPPTRGYGMGLMIFSPETFGHTGTLESTHAMTARGEGGYTWAITVSGDHPSSSRDLAGIIAEGFRYAGVSGD